MQDIVDDALLHGDGANQLPLGPTAPEPSTLRRHLAMKSTIATRTTNTRRTVGIAAAVAATLGMSACGAVADKAAEKGVEQVIESSLDDELGDFDIDLDLSDGDFSIETDDGTFSFGEDGSIVLDTDEGMFTGQVDESGIEINGSNGEVVDIDLATTGNDDNGSDGGSISIETDDGVYDASFGFADWSNWPSEIPRPNFTADEWISGSTDDNGLWIIAGGTVDGSPDQVVADYAALFADAAITAEDWGDETEALTITTNGFTISLLGDPNDLRGGTNLSITLATI